jgi:hypothetical protein
VEGQQHTAILQRTHALLAQYAELPGSWDQVWEEADTDHARVEAGEADAACASVTAGAVAAALLRLLDSAVYDGEARVLLPTEPLSAAPGSAAAAPAGGVLAEVSRALRPLSSFVGRQHLAALQALAGPVALQALIAGVLDKLEAEQVGSVCTSSIPWPEGASTLTDLTVCRFTPPPLYSQDKLLPELARLQQRLPHSLLQLPPAEQCHSAPAVLQFYQHQLSGALDDGACAAALGGLQRIGSCLALLHLLSVQQAVQATPTFMQVCVRVRL